MPVQDVQPVRRENDSHLVKGVYVWSARRCFTIPVPNCGAGLQRMTSKSFLLRRGIASAIIECETAVHTIRAASYECVHTNGGLTISFELCPTGTSARLDASEVFDTPIQKIYLPDLRVRKRLLAFFLKAINSTCQFFSVGRIQV